MVAALRLPGSVVAGVGQAAFQVCFLTAVASTGVAVGTLVAIGSAPLWAGVLTGRVSRAWWTATALAISGLARLAPAGVLGALLVLAALVVLACATSRAPARG